jgi:hypothetical protein
MVWILLTMHTDQQGALVNSHDMVNNKPKNALIIPCIGTQYSPTCFGTLKYHHQKGKHDPAV